MSVNSLLVAVNGGSPASGPATVKVGDRLRFVIFFANKGPQIAHGVNVSFQGPGPHMQDVQVFGSGSCSGGTCTYGTVLPDSGAHGMEVRGTPTEVGVLDVTVTVSSQDSDPTGDNNTKHLQVTVVTPQADLSLESVFTMVNTSQATYGGATAKVGDHLRFSIRLKNRGPDTARNVTVSFQGPGPHMDQVSVGASSGSCNGGTCKLGDLASGAYGSMSVSGTPTEAGVLNITATVSSATGDAQPGNNRRQLQVTVRALQADLSLQSLTVSRNGGPPSSYPFVDAKIGDRLHFQIGFANSGPDRSGTITVTFQGPGPHMQDVQVSGPGATCSGGTCTLGGIGIGQPRTMDVFGTPTEKGVLAVTVTISSTTADPHPENNRKQTTVPVS
jgi:hypothetical protein